MRNLAPLIVASSIASAFFLSLANSTKIALIGQLPVAAILAVVSYATYMHFLSGEKITGRGVFLQNHPKALSNFVLLSAFVLVLDFLTDLILRAVMQGDMLNSAGANIVLAVIYLIIFARYGTIFPAIVAGDDTSLPQAARRSDMFKVVWRLLLIGLAGAAVIVAFALLGGIMGILLKSQALLTPVTALAAVVVSLCVIWMAVATAIVLGKAYLGAYKSGVS